MRHGDLLTCECNLQRICSKLLYGCGSGPAKCRPGRLPRCAGQNLPRPCSRRLKLLVSIAWIKVSTASAIPKCGGCPGIRCGFGRGHAISPNPGDRETRLPSSERPVSLLTPRWRKTDSNPRSLLGPEWICVETFRSAEGRKRSAEGLSLLPDRFHPSSFVDGRQSRSRECGREARLAALLRSRAPNGSKSDDPGPRCLRSGGLAACRT